MIGIELADQHAFVAGVGGGIGSVCVTSPARRSSWTVARPWSSRCRSAV